jgi:hypothetical protein
MLFDSQIIHIITTLTQRRGTMSNTLRTAVCLIVPVMVLGLVPFATAAEPVSVSNTFMGSSSYDEGRAVAVDPSGNIYVAGQSNATWGTPVRPHSGGNDVFVAKLGPDLVLQWNTFLGSGSEDLTQNTIAVDAFGNVYVGGWSDATWGSPLDSYTGNEDAFVAKLNASGVLQWHVFMGNESTDIAHGLALDASGNVHMSGWTVNNWNGSFWGTPVNPGGCCQNAFVVKLSSSGVPHWVTFLGGDAGVLGTGVAVDASGNVYVGGRSDATWGTPINDHTGSGGEDGFAAKLGSNGVLQWNTFFGGSFHDESWDIALDAGGNIYLSGHGLGTWGLPIDPYVGGEWDAFVVKLNNNGIRQWNTFLGSTSHDFGLGVAADMSGSAYVGGMSCGTWGTPIIPHHGGCDISIAEIGGNGSRVWNTFLGSVDFEGAGDVFLDPSRTIYLTGVGGANWGTPTSPHSGGLDAVVVKIETAFEVGIDIKPGSYPNCFNNNGSGLITVAVLGASDFDVTEIDATTLGFGGLNVRVKGNGKPQCVFEDVSGDDTLRIEETEVTLVGEWFGEAYPEYSGGTAVYANFDVFDPGAYATFEFGGTGVAWIGARTFNGGLFDWIIDEGTTHQRSGTVNTYIDGVERITTEPLVDDLAPDHHTFKFVSSGIHGGTMQAELPSETYIDAFDIFTSPSGEPDGHLDLVCHFVDDESFTWEAGTGTAELTGNLDVAFGGTAFRGTDSICIVP